MTESPGTHPAGSAYDKNLGQALGVQAFGIYQIDAGPSSNREHTHTDDAAVPRSNIPGAAGYASADGVSLDSVMLPMDVLRMPDG